MKIISPALAMFLLAGCASSNGKAPADAPAEDRISQLVAAYTDFNTGTENLSLWGESFNMVSVDSPFAPPVEDLDGWREFIKKLKTSYPDYKVVPGRVFELDANTVFVEAMFTGTNTGPMMNGAPASGKQIGGTVGHLYTFGADGKVASLDVYIDELAIMVQLGVMPPPMGDVPPVPTLPAEPTVVRGSGDAKAGELAKALNQAIYVDKDQDKWGAMMDENVQVGFPAVEKRSGLENVKKSNAPFAAAFAEEKIDVAKVWTVGGFAIATVTHDGKHTGKIGPFEATNKNFSRKFIGVYNVEDGKLTAMSAYSNPLGPMKQLGLLKMPEAPAPAPAE